MRFVTKEVIGLFMATILVYLILAHAGGFARAVSATGTSLSGIAKTLQGRG